MSKETRISVADHKNLVLRSPQQHDDLVNLNGCKTELIECLKNILDSGVIVEITSLKSDHHDDSALSNTAPNYYGTHHYGWAFDWWPLVRRERAAYMSASDPRFQRALRVAARAPNLRQIGLAGEADTEANHLAAGPTYFPDAGDSHIHTGTGRKS